MERMTGEMTKLLLMIQARFGPLERWSDDALDILETWLVDMRLAVDREWHKRGDGDDD